MPEFAQFIINDYLADNDMDDLDKLIKVTESVEGLSRNARDLND